jgi:hypothetical protein
MGMLPRARAGSCAGHAFELRGWLWSKASPKSGLSGAHGGAAAWRSASPGASSAGGGASAVAPRSSQNGASDAACAGRANDHTASTMLAKSAARRARTTIGGVLWIGALPVIKSGAQRCQDGYPQEATRTYMPAPGPWP